MLLSSNPKSPEALFQNALSQVDLLSLDMKIPQEELDVEKEVVDGNLVVSKE